MSKPRVLVTRIIPEAGLRAVRDFAEVDIWQGEGPIPYERLLEKIENVEGLYCLLTDKVDAELLEHAPRLRGISTMAVGYDNIDIEVCTRRGIPVGNTPGVLTETTADFAFALLMASARRVVEGAEYVKAGRWVTWEPTLLLGQDIHDATLGIVGYGRIGQAVARRAIGFGMRVLVCSSRSIDRQILQKSKVEQTSFETLVKEADYLSLHVPLTPETHHLISHEVFQKMKRTAVLINTARGPVVDSVALFQTLQNCTIAYAALDVTDPEPLSSHDPLLSLTNCLVVPHIASASVATRNKMAIIAAENLRAGLEGQQLPHCVNSEVYPCAERRKNH